MQLQKALVVLRVFSGLLKCGKIGQTFPYYIAEGFVINPMQTFKKEGDAKQLLSDLLWTRALPIQWNSPHCCLKRQLLLLFLAQHCLELQPFPFPKLKDHHPTSNFTNPCNQLSLSLPFTFYSPQPQQPMRSITATVTTKSSFLPAPFFVHLPHPLLAQTPPSKRLPQALQCDPQPPRSTRLSVKDEAFRKGRQNTSSVAMNSRK